MARQEGEQERPGSNQYPSAGQTARTKLCRGTNKTEASMKTWILLAATLLPSIDHSNGGRPGSSAPPAACVTSPEAGAVSKSFFLDFCSKIEDEQAKLCASQCAARGKAYAFEISFCGLSSTCKCS